MSISPRCSVAAATRSRTPCSVPAVAGHGQASGLGGDRCGGPWIQVVHHEPGLAMPTCRTPPRDRPADPAATAGDDNPGAAHVCHVRTITSRSLTYLARRDQAGQPRLRGHAAGVPGLNSMPGLTSKVSASMLAPPSYRR